ncbi:Serine/threonine protein kinase prp4 [Entamoeba marina]
MTKVIDMFADDDSSDQSVERISTPVTQNLPQTEAIESTTDEEGYFIGRMGQLINKYEITVKIGQGMYGSVYLAKADKEVAIKIVRQNESMVKTLQREAQIVKSIMQLGGVNIVKMLDQFMYKGHYCIVLEKMRMNLRELLDEKTKGKGLNIQTVKRYSYQIFKALDVLHSVCNIYHCDIKPDNILVDDTLENVKLADFGSALHPYEAQLFPSLGSRYYRSPEVIVGYKFDGETDIWSFATTLAELFTGKILFEGISNNDMLYQFMLYKGKFPNKMIREGKVSGEHFTNDLIFIHEDVDLIGKSVLKRLNIKQPVKRLLPFVIDETIKYPKEQLKEIYHFIDLLEHCLVLDPEKRLTARATLSHQFYENSEKVSEK